MKLTICAVGRLKNGPERELWQRYATRISSIGKSQCIDPLKLIEISEARDANASARKSAEASKLASKLGSSDLIIALDENGTQVTSNEIAATLQREADAGRSAITFLIGGPDGLSPDLLDQTKEKWAFGRITLPHGVVRAILAEQLYRALTIMAGHPYHRA